MAYPPPPVKAPNILQNWSKEELRGKVNSHYRKSTLTSIEIRESYISQCTLLRARLYDCELVDSTITNSILKDCIVINCQIDDTTFESSYLEGTSKLSKSILRDCKVFSCPWARDCDFRGCSISASHVVRSKFHGSRIANCKDEEDCIQTSELKGCEAKSSYLLNCAIEDSIVDTTKIHECKLIKSSVLKSDVTSSPLALHKFAPELRAMIFSKAIGTKLVAALRPNTVMYEEAIKIFREHFPYRVTPANAKFRATIPPSLIQKVDSVIVRYAVGDMVLDCKELPRELRESKSIVSILIDFRLTPFELGRFFEVARLWTPALGTIKKFSVRFPRRKAVLGWHGEWFIVDKDRWHETGSTKILTEGNKCFKVEAKCIFKSSLGSDHWVWEASSGKVLNWTNIRS